MRKVWVYLSVVAVLWMTAGSGERNLCGWPRLRS
jgi:hypothetical protein